MAEAGELERGGGEAHATAAGFVFALLPIILVLTHRTIAPAYYLLVAIALAHGPTRAGAWTALRRAAGRRPDAATIAAIFTILFCGFVALSGLWSPRPDKWTWGPSLFTVLAGAFVLAQHAAAIGERALRRFALLALGGVAAGGALLALEALTGGALRAATPPERATRALDLNSVGRGVTVYCALVWPAVFVAWRVTGRRLLAVLPLGAAFLAAALLPIQTNVAALALGAVLGGLALLARKTAIILAAGLWAVGLFGAPVAAFALPPLEALSALDGLPASVAHRLMIWRATGDLLLAHPWGAGVEFARAAGAESAFAVLDGRTTELRVLPLHPHSVFLQIWLELGPVGAFLAAAAITAVALGFLRSDFSRSETALFASVLGAAFVSALFEASLWQIWRPSAVALSCCIATLSIAASRRNLLHPR